MKLFIKRLCDAANQSMSIICLRSTHRILLWTVAVDCQTNSSILKFNVKVCSVVPLIFFHGTQHNLYAIISLNSPTGIGWGMLVVSTLVAIYYNMIIAWALYYFVASFFELPRDDLPWTKCIKGDSGPCKCASQDQPVLPIKSSQLESIFHL